MTDRAAARGDAGRDRPELEARREDADPTPSARVDDGAARAIDPIDREIGRRVRARRVAMGFSQKRLSGLLGVRFQQVQKYESGANRIAASRLLDIAEALRTPIDYFYADLPSTCGPAADADLIDRVQAIPGVPALLAGFGSIPNAGVRRKLLGLAKAIIGAEGESPARGDQDGGVGKGATAP